MEISNPTLSGEMINCSLDEAADCAFSGSNDCSPVNSASVFNLDNLVAQSDSKTADPSATVGASSEKKKKNRRKWKGGKKRQKRLYTTVSADEQNNIQLQKHKSRRRKRFSTTGQAMAPDNTTQFLMDIHEPDPNCEDHSELPPQRRRRHSTSFGQDTCSATASEDCYTSGDDDLFLEREFSADYENYQMERISSMSKDELVKEYLELEQKCDALERKMRVDSNPCDVNCLANNSGSDVTHFDQPETELLRLRSENEQLRRENEALRAQLQRTENKENDEPDLDS